MTIVTIERTVRLPSLKRIQVYGVPGDTNRYVQYEAQMRRQRRSGFERQVFMPPRYHVYFYPARRMLVVCTFVKHKPVGASVRDRIDSLILMAIDEDLKSNPI